MGGTICGGIWTFCMGKRRPVCSAVASASGCESGGGSGGRGRAPGGEGPGGRPRWERHGGAWESRAALVDCLLVLQALATSAAPPTTAACSRVVTGRVQTWGHENV